MTALDRRHFLIVGASVLAASACSSSGAGDAQDKIDNPDPNLNTTGMPIVKEPVTLSFLSGRPPMTADDWNAVESMKYMEQISGVHVDFGTVPLDGVKERRNLALASGDYPGALFRTSLSAGEIAKYADQGTFISLSTLIDKYMPNLTAIMEKRPNVRKGLTFPDGNIYSLPQIYDPEFLGMRYMMKLWVRQDWLDKFGMDVPTTLDEYEAYLTSVVKENPAREGDAIGLADGAKFGDLYSTMLGTFGIGNKGTDVGSVDLDPDSGKVRFVPTADGYREMMTYLNKLYAQGLIMPDLFSTDAAKFNTLGGQGLLGSAATQTPSGFFGKEGENYVALAPLKKSSDAPQPQWHAVRSELAGIGQFVMTDRNEHPIETARWMDHFYSDEGARLFFMGIEGKSYEKRGDGYELTDDIAHNPDGKSIDDGLRPYVIYMGGRYPGYATAAYFKGVENTPQATEGSKVVQPHALEEVWPAFNYTKEEAAEMESISADIGKYASESRAAFITGQKPLTEWDAHLAQFEQMGLPRYLEIQQAALERFQAN
ncbi:extracellular solute-binding protein [Propionibacteriaceae bacterium Y1685]